MLASTGDCWKELAEKISKMETSLTVRKMIAAMNEKAPFAKATGILDNGCGPGGVISHILDQYGSEIPESATVLAADYSAAMLGKLDENKQVKISSGHQVWERLETKSLDAHDISAIADGSLSHITAGHVYFLLADPRKALKEAHRVLKSGGAIAVSSGKSGQHMGILQDSVEVIRTGTHFRMLSEPWKSEEGAKGELEATGFTDVQTFSVDSEVKYESHEDFAKMLLSMPVMKNITEGYDEDEQQRLHVEVVQGLRSVNPAEPGALTGSSVVAIASKA